MDPTAGLAATGQRHIDASRREFGLDRGARERLARGLHRGLELLLRLVDARTDRRPIGGRQRTERLQLLGERAFFTEPAYADLVEGGERGARRDLVEGLAQEGREIAHDPILRRCRALPWPW